MNWVLFKFFMFYSSFSCFIQVFNVLFKFLYSYINCDQKVHTIMNKSIQSLRLSAYKYDYVHTSEMLLVGQHACAGCQKWPIGSISTLAFAGQC